jgi:hypothetical protein
VLAASLLLEPLGISDVAWTWLPNGDPKDWCCVWMHPRDMAKIGQLVLDRGRWKGEQIISEGWIDTATAQCCRLCGGRLDLSEPPNRLAQPSPDRIDSSLKVYDETNLQIAHLACNWAKKECPNTEALAFFRSWCGDGIADDSIANDI